MFLKNYVNIRGQKLNTYTYNSSGDMTGGHFTETIKRYDEKHAIIIHEKAEWHNSEPVITKYLVDIAIMDEIEIIIRKCSMNHWNRKRFSRVFIADGSSHGYSFEFDTVGIYFSSQYYPRKYRDKLNILDEAVKKYLADGKIIKE